MNKSIIIFTLIFGLLGCSNSSENSGILLLEEELIFSLDSLTPNTGNHYSLYLEKDKKVLYVLTPFNNRFVFYDFDSKSKLGEFVVDNDFGNVKIGLAPPSGFYIHNLDSIFVYDYRRHSLYLTNTSGQLSMIYGFMRNFPNDRSFWSGIYSESRPFFIDKDLISLGGSVESAQVKENQKVDVLLNLKTMDVERETLLPSSYLKDHFYSPVRLRPSRAFNRSKNLVYYSYYNSDSVYVRNLSDESWDSYIAKPKEILPFTDIKEFSRFKEAESGGDNQLFYNVTQGGHFSIFYDEINNKVVRVSFLGNKDFEIDKHHENPYKFNFVLSFYDPVSFEKFGSYTIGQFDYRFMFFTENYFYVIEEERNVKEDELVISKYKYPDF